MYTQYYTGLGSCRSLSLWQWMDCERMESPAPTDRMPKNSRMNNYFLIGGWQRKSGITNFPKFCIELHSSLLTLPAAGCWRPGHRQKVCGQKMQRAAGTSPAQPSQPSPAQPSPGGTTPDLQTVHQPSTRQTLLAAQLLKYASWSKSTFPLTSDMFSDWIFALMVDATEKGFNNLLKPNFVLHMGVTVIPNLPRLCWSYEPWGLCVVMGESFKWVSQIKTQSSQNMNPANPAYRAQLHPA